MIDYTKKPKPDAAPAPTAAAQTAAVFPVTEIRASVEHYTRLGFEVVWDYVGTRDFTWGYAFMRWQGVGLHLIEKGATGFDREQNATQAFIGVPDPAAVVRAWQATGAGRTGDVWDSPLGPEAFHTDPDYNTIRIGGLPPI